MIYSAPGATIEIACQGLPPSLPAGTVGVSVKDKPAGGAVVQARATAGITEDPAGSGQYGKSDLVAPTTGGTFWLHWDSGLNIAPFAVEELVVTYSAPVAADPGAGLEFTPTVGEVGVLLWARTKDDDGNVDGTFTADTRPTATQAEVLIGQAVNDVAMRVGDAVPAALWSSARSVVALRAAQLVELSYFPEQTDGDAVIYQTLRLTYEEQLAKLVIAVQLRMVFSEPVEESV